MPLLVWSERGEAPGQTRLTDCTYAAVLMALVWGGLARFALGLYTAAERNELERHDHRPDNTGATFTDTDLAVVRRYGVRLHLIPDGSAGGLARQLRTPGRAWAIAGRNDRLEKRLRGWDPGFTGAHAVCVADYRAADDSVLWLDPLAPMRYKGDRASVATVLAWAFVPNDARYLDAGELAGGDVVNLFEPDDELGTGVASFAAGTTYQLFRPGPDPDPATWTAEAGLRREYATPADRGSSAPFDGPWGWTGHRPGGRIRYTAGVLKGWCQSSGGPQPALEWDAAGPVDCAPAVEAATAPYRQLLEQVRELVS